MKPDNKLLQYSTFAVSFLFLKEADGEAVYTDIDPDTVIDNHLELVRLDIDDNGILDFAFLKFTGIGYTYWGSDYLYFYYLHAAPQYPSNAIAGLKSVIDPSYGGFTLYYPYALLSNEFIDEGLDFQNDFYQIIAGRIVLDGVTITNRGKWTPEKTDNYFGIRFLDEYGCNHYGWIRCDTKGKGDTLIIKDYAYETKCDVGILAGDTIGDTTTVGIEENNILDATVYSFKNTLYINLNELISDLEIHVFDVTGKKVYSDKITNLQTQIELIEAKGTYIIKLFSPEGKFTKKIFIN
ncbi:MAG: T9SS type A sorting domain-containing protein [Bacteroidetes bacterium]|nr:T9SS type A sorting domain-containing protein [Bacteroidota bacterium]MBP8754872.1 T9SS type A sorting domain-containing protein [Chitinophagales bacterium]MBP9189641.1 T9SS type A sorting domain-containing protein [Chitinophagales bacterium]MBP9795065.1 T9SS type A sorting domain-containing protein [Chitinophagales bacterium]